MSNELEKKDTMKKLFIILFIVIAFISGWYFAKLKNDNSSINNTISFHISNPNYEYLVSSSTYQLSAEADALIMQSYDIVKNNVLDLVKKCEDETQLEWNIIKNSDSEKEMYHNNKRVAIITDIDDTLVNGVNYTADILGNDGDYNNAAFSRFLMSDACVALPGAVDCMNFCKENGIEIYYITNRYDQGYKVGQSDSKGSYEQYKKEYSEGNYLSKDGKIIGTSIYQLYGKSMYDITIESMKKLGFPVDDSHLIINDNKLKGASKEKARQAIINGCKDYENGQRKNENSLNTKEVFSCEPHDVVMFLGDQMTDFTDDFDNQKLDAIERRKLSKVMQENYGKKWIVFPNAVYGKQIDTGLAYDIEKLLKEYAYTNMKNVDKISK